jgi:hypothetical protein
LPRWLHIIREEIVMIEVADPPPGTTSPAFIKVGRPLVAHRSEKIGWAPLRRIGRRRLRLTPAEPGAGWAAA